MSQSLSVNGVNYSYPETGERDWGDQATAWAIAVTSGMLQKAGGTFTLTADIDFGASFGLKSLYYKTRSTPLATAGHFRLARTDVISWRNAADSANLDLTVNGSNLLTFAGNALLTGSDLNSLINAEAEDQNLIVQGGGKVSWDGAQVTFSANIDIYNSVTAFKNIITTAASPRTLDANGKVAYAALSRAPGADNSITSLTSVAQGSLPNGVTALGTSVFTFFHRTTDGTLYIPWAKKELLSGDHWQVGTGLTWYERIAMSRKPGYKANASDSSQVKVPGSAAAPAVVIIDGKIYANTSDATMDLDTAGRNGLDTGTKTSNTVYYLYAIPAASGRTFDVVCSTTAPSGAGPTGFSSWSYIGAFCTKIVSSVVPFVAANGLFKSDVSVSSTTTTTSTTPVQKALATCPTTVKSFWGAVRLTAGTAVGSGGVVAGQGTHSLAGFAIRTTLQVSGTRIDDFGYVPALDGTNVWLSSESASNTAQFDLYGWIEDPMEWK